MVAQTFSDFLGRLLSMFISLLLMVVFVVCCLSKVLRARLDFQNFNFTVNYWQIYNFFIFDFRARAGAYYHYVCCIQ